MTMDITKAERERFLSLLEIVRREGDLLLKTDARLFKVNLDAAWVERLENEEDLAERLDAFVSRFGRMQDTLGDKLIPDHWRRNPAARWTTSTERKNSVCWHPWSSGWTCAICVTSWYTSIWPMRGSLPWR